MENIVRPVLKKLLSIHKIICEEFPLKHMYNSPVHFLFIYLQKPYILFLSVFFWCATSLAAEIVVTNLLGGLL